MAEPLEIRSLATRAADDAAANGPVEWVAPDALGPRVAGLVADNGRFVTLVGLDERSVGG